MTTNDGYILGKQKIVDNGPASQRWNLVILSDGYQSNEIQQFAHDAQAFIDVLFATPPLNEICTAINVYRVDVVSTDSGADDPTACGGTGLTAATYFDSTFCADGVTYRLLAADSNAAQTVAFNQVPETDAIVVMVNTPVYGGAGGSIATVSTHANAPQIANHELGHSAFSLADEYCDVYGTWTGGEPSSPNITIDTNRNTIKWSHLIDATTPMPTTSNADCTTCDTQASPVAAGTVGAFEGAARYKCGVYRPVFTCKMRALGWDFCPVCQERIRQTFQGYGVVVPSVNPVSQSLVFSDIPEGIGGSGVTTRRAILFEKVSCEDVTLRITTPIPAGFDIPTDQGTEVVVSPSDDIGQVWISYTSTNAGDTAEGSITVEWVETGQSWVIDLFANTVGRPKAAIALILDRSGSMREYAGDGFSKIQKLKEAVSTFTSVMLEGDGLGIVRYNHSSDILMPIADVGPVTPIDPNSGRQKAQDILDGTDLNPSGSTSIGAGILEAKQSLNDAQASAAEPFEVTAMVVLTDGNENTLPRISEVNNDITSRTFAIGFGTADNVSAPVLNALTQNNNGYLLVTGEITSEQTYKLQKYFLQILAGITNANILLDPQGHLASGSIHRIPFGITEAEYGFDVILLSSAPQYIKFLLETPDGQIIEPSTANQESAINYVMGKTVNFYRISLPVFSTPPPDIHVGKWHVILSLREKLKEGALLAASHRMNPALSYSLIIHEYSNISFNASTIQKSFEPGSEVMINAIIHEYDLPVEERARVWAEVTRPDSTRERITFFEEEPGKFKGLLKTRLPGVYDVHLHSLGRTLEGSPFRCEQRLTVPVYWGGDRYHETLTSLSWLRELERRFCLRVSCLRELLMWIILVILSIAVLWLILV